MRLDYESAKSDSRSKIKSEKEVKNKFKLVKSNLCCCNCKSFECNKSKDTNVRNGQSLVNTITYQNLILKEVKLCSLHLTFLIGTVNQKMLCKKRCLRQIKEHCEIRTYEHHFDQVEENTN